MNELETVRTVRRALDARAEYLSYRVTHRLEVARERALGRMPASVKVASGVQQGELALTGGNAPRLGEHGLAWRLASMVVPIVVLVAGLVLVSQWSEVLRTREVADIDTAVLLDDVPISAYADNGFGVFLKNVRE
ncbi:MAG: DUF3619 family protein [Burkholderiaceae bacterium]|nr:DUF3619 family protein [Burkholderiaceae bacterium]